MVPLEKSFAMDHAHHHHHGEHTEGEQKQQKPPHHGDAHDEHAHHEHAHHEHQRHDDHAGGEMKNHGNHHDHSHHSQQFLPRFWVSLALTVPILLLSHMIQQWLGFSFHIPGHNIVLFVLGSIVFVYGGAPFLTGAVTELKQKAPGMMTLVAVAISTAFLYSTAVIFGLSGMDFFWELATLIDIMLLGHWLEMKSQASASRALESLVQLMPATVHLEENGNVVDRPLASLQSGAIAVVRPGEKIPADGKVIGGSSYVNESMVTGESVPVKKEDGETVIGGSLNGDGMLRIHVTGAGENSYLNKVIKLVQSAQDTKSRTQHLANKVAKWLTLVALTVGIITLVVWVAAGAEFSFALERMVTVMVTSCPHALGVAIPLVVAISTSVSASRGLLIRNRTSFENARNIDTIIFDKTGTLTKGSHEVQRIVSLNNSFNEHQVLQFAAAVQQHSEHHIAHGIIKKLKDQQLSLPGSDHFTYMQGMGVSANVNGKKVVVAGPNYFRHQNTPVPQIPGGVGSAETMVYVLVDDSPAGAITLADSIRSTSAKAISRLHQMNIETQLLTGDNETVAASVAEQLHMDGFVANVLPHEKLEHIKAFQKQGKVVAMVGDGVNDAPALAQADVGIAVGSGTDVAAETADIILVNSDPQDVADAIGFAKKTYRKMIQNLVWAIGYNVIAIPLAAGILYPHFMLSPAMGAVLMSLSTVVVAINAQLLRSSLRRS